jgi:hypothetical protein
MEEELLQGMIRDRETQIKLIEKKMEEQTRKMERLKQQHTDLEASYRTSHVDGQLELEGMRQRLRKLVQQYQQTKDSLDMKKQNAQAQTGLHLYNEVMRAVATPESTDSSYVMRMQAQLCKAMHSMGMMETQLHLARGQSEVYTRYLKDSITGMVEEKSQVELKLMNDLVVADNARREVETTTKEMAEALSREKDELMEKIERQHSKQEDEDGDQAKEEGDEEEEKEELMEILKQGREEMERLEQENKDEAEKLEALKEKVAQTRGRDLVDEIVSSIADEFKEREGGSEDEEEE